MRRKRKPVIDRSYRVDQSAPRPGVEASSGAGATPGTPVTVSVPGQGRASSPRT